MKNSLPRRSPTTSSPDLPLRSSPMRDLILFEPGTASWNDRAICLEKDALWRKDPQNRHKLVVIPSRRLFILRSAHDDIGHKGFYATRALIAERFWWPHMADDIAWFIRTVATPAPIFAKMYMDTMHLPPSGGFKYIVQGRCSLIHYPEFRMLRRETGKSIGDWIFQDILCRWGTLVEIVTDNGSPFLKALAYLEKQYKIRHIRISGYNSRANLAERPHFDVRQSLYKAVDGDQSKWHSYFAATGTHPLLPLDIAEATYLLPAPDSPLSTTDLIARRAVALQKRRDQLSLLHSNVFEARIRAAIRFEREHAATIRDFDFQRGDLVLMRNTAIEKSLNRKMRARYLGPLIVISRNRGGAYILCELDGSVLHRPIAAFRVIPYFAREKLPIPDLDELIDISTDRLRQLEDSTLEDPEDDDPDPAADGETQ